MGSLVIDDIEDEIAKKILDGVFKVTDDPKGGVCLYLNSGECIRRKFNPDQVYNAILGLRGDPVVKDTRKPYYPF